MNSLGLDYYTKSDLRQALNRHFCSVDLKTKMSPNDNHTHIARVSGLIANIFQVCGDFKLAHYYLWRALLIEQRLLPQQHIYIAFRYENLASLYACEKKYALALVYYLQALDIVRRTLPIYHNKNLLISNGIKNVLKHLSA